MEGRKFNVTPVDWVAKAGPRKCCAAFAHARLLLAEAIARIALPGFLEEGPAAQAVQAMLVLGLAAVAVLRQASQRQRLPSGRAWC